MATPSVPPARAAAKPRAPSAPASQPRRGPSLPLRRLAKTWKGQRDPDAPKALQDLPLSAVLLSGLTISADEGPAIDVLHGCFETIDGWRRSRAEDADTIEVSLAEVMLLARRLDVAMELIRRGAGAFPKEPDPRGDR